MQHRFSAAFAAFLVSLPLAAQTPAVSPMGRRPASAALRPWIGCKLAGGPDLLQTTPLPQTPMTRPAQTLTGPRPIKIADGLFAAFGYAGSAPFANIKIEQLPGSAYSAEKATLISEFDAINAKGEDTQRNYGLERTLNGFEIYGFDRTALDGNVLGIYLFFENSRHVATTAYFLNAPAGQRRFQTVADYTTLRKGFLEAYTGCVRRALSGTAPAKVPAKVPARASARVPARIPARIPAKLPAKLAAKLPAKARTRKPVRRR